MGIKHHHDLIQGTEEWHAARCGLLTASEMKLIITPAKLQYASNEKERSHLYELLAQRITGYVEPHYIGDDMLRGMEDEIEAKNVYRQNYGEVTDVGFITNDKWGFTLGYSPDGIVGDDGLIECKSRRQKFQVQAILNDEMDTDFMIQVQTGMMISERKWVDFVTYSGGLPMMTKRIYVDQAVQDAILAAARIFHGKIEKGLADYKERLTSAQMRLIPTKRKEPQQEITA